MKTAIFTVIFGSLFAFGSASAQILIEDPERPRRTAEVGEKAARKYFQAREGGKKAARRAVDADRFMALYFGGFVSDKQHRWGRQEREEDVGEVIFGVDYRVGEWVSSMDMMLRAELLSYELDDENPLLLNLMPIVTFPDFKGGFPLYFGAGAGVGVFFRQLENESDLSLNYNVLAGVRFPELFEKGGLMLETGLLGHVHVLSSGQFSGVYLKVGSVFAF